MTHFIISLKPEDGAHIRRNILGRLQTRFPQHTFEVSGGDYPGLENSIIPVRGKTSDPKDRDRVPDGVVDEVKGAFGVMLSAAREWKPSKYGKDLARRDD